jgi:DNA-binding NtrC family response regulator
MRPRILLITPTQDLGPAIGSMLERHQYEVSRADDHRRAAERLGIDHFDVLIVEVKATAEDAGLHFLRHVNSAVPHLLPRVVVISSDASASVRNELDGIGVCDVVLKPVHEEEILKAVQECLDSMSASVH